MARDLGCRDAMRGSFKGPCGGQWNSALASPTYPSCRGKEDQCPPIPQRGLDGAPVDGGSNQSQRFGDLSVRCRGSYELDCGDADSLVRRARQRHRHFEPLTINYDKSTESASTTSSR